MERKVSQRFEHAPLLPFNFAECDWIGFDLDHTLIRYRLGPLRKLTSKLLINFLVQSRGRARAQFDEQPGPDFEAKGLVFDCQLGLFVKLDENACVTKACRGPEGWCSADEIAELYGGKPLPAFAGATTQRYWPLHSYFETVAASLIASMVAYFNIRNQGSPEVYRQMVDDIFAGFYALFGLWESSPWFAAFRANALDYIYPRPFLRSWAAAVKTYREKNTKGRRPRIFLATNSKGEFADCLLRAAVGDDWRSLFDFVIYRANKPRFFAQQVQFMRVHFSAPLTCTLGRYVDGSELSLNDEVDGGSVGELHKFFVKLALQENPERRATIANDLSVAYVGDHLVGDCFAPRFQTNWRTVGVVDELADLERIAGVPEAFYDEIESHADDHGDASTSGNVLHSHGTDEHHLTAERALVECAKIAPRTGRPASHAHSPCWGNFFFTDDGRFTYFARLMYECCSLYVSDVRHVLSLKHFGLDHEFSVEHSSQLQLIPKQSAHIDELSHPTYDGEQVEKASIGRVVVHLEKNLVASEDDPFAHAMKN